MLDFPNSPSVGQIFNSGTGAIYIWDGVAWSVITNQLLTADRRNRITNPNMVVSQENGFTQAVAAATSSYFSADQWLHSWNTATGSIRAGLSATGGPDGLYHCYLNIVTAQASLSAGNIGLLRQNLEGLNVADFLWGTASAKQVVLRFSVMVPVSGTYCVRIANGDTTRSYVAAFSVPTANVWQDVVLVIPGDTTGTWATDNSRALYLDFCCGTGSTYVGVAGWQAGNFYATAAQVNGLGTVGLFRVANVGLHADPNKTGLPPPFEAPDIATELAKCARYWQRLSSLLCSGEYANAGGQLLTCLTFQLMRTSPTVAMLNIGYSNASALSTNRVQTNNLTFQATMTAAGAGWASFDSTLNARM
jgi:hypothetical protein